MLSVLIPIYNFDIRQLAQELSDQCGKSATAFEIICIDDCSQPAYKQKNIEVSDLYGIKYIELEENIGRSKIRELLANKAKYEHLIFLDCDVEISQHNFIQRYMDQFAHPVVVGGISYELNAPSNPEFVLRWKYGKEREQRTAEQRNSSQFIHFLASNLMINRELFLSIPLQESIEGYGHEDTWLGLILEERKVPILHIDNSIKHIGLDTASEFLKKSLSGVINLVRLYPKISASSDLKLITVFNTLRRFKLVGMVFLVLKFRVKAIERNLIGKDPNLSLFDQWKLFQFIKHYRKLS